MATATCRANHGIIVLGAEPLPPDVLAAAAECDEVFVVARAVDAQARWLVDEDRARRDAHERLEGLRRYLRARGVRVRGALVDADAAAAHRDGAALCPDGVFLN
jgi:hypothetical protein